MQIDGEDIISSPQSLTQAYVRFVNVTGMTLKLWWYNFEGNTIPYGVIPKGGFKDVNTFEDHAWCFTDMHTLERYKVNGQKVFRAKPKFLTRGDRILETRSKWNIHRDVRSLQLESIRLIARCLVRPHFAALLEIPSHLKGHIEQMAVLHEHCVANVELCDFYN